jgi:hypothetical protein
MAMDEFGVLACPCRANLASDAVYPRLIVGVLA